MGCRFALLPLAGLLASISPAPVEAAPRVERQRFRDGARVLTVERDGFSGATRCALEGRGGSRYSGGAVMFSLRGVDDIGDVWFRIDDGQPRRWRDILPALASTEAVVDLRADVAAEFSRFAVPADSLADARTVAFPRGFGKRPTRFHRDGFARLRKAAALECAPTDFEANRR